MAKKSTSPAAEFTGRLAEIAKLMTRKNGVNINEIIEAVGYNARPKVHEIIRRSSHSVVTFPGKDGLTRYAFAR